MGKDVASEHVAWKSAFVAVVRARDEPIADEGHPRLTALLLLVQQPNRADAAVTFFDHRLRKSAEEAFDVRLAHQEIERELHDVGLHGRETFGALPLARLTNERASKHLEILGEHFLRLMVATRVGASAGLRCR